MFSFYFIHLWYNSIQKRIRNSSRNIVNNGSKAEKRLEHLKSNFNRDCSYKKDYVSSMSEMIIRGYAEHDTSDQNDQPNASKI